jgi:hypothetical protein
MKYLIEGDINFYDEVNNNNHVFSFDNCCLISNETLTDKFVTMECGHKFNYIPLYNDLYNHKYCTNNMESFTTKLSANAIRCPYCRCISKRLIPFYEDLFICKDVKVRKIMGVNNYILCSKFKYLTCNIILKEKQIWEKENRQIMTTVIKDAKLKLKNDSKLQKIKAKELIKLHKINLKNEAKLEKIKAKEVIKLYKINLKNQAKIEKINLKNQAKLEKIKAKEVIKLGKIHLKNQAKLAKIKATTVI